CPTRPSDAGWELAGSGSTPSSRRGYKNSVAEGRRWFEALQQQRQPGLPVPDHLCLRTLEHRTGGCTRFDLEEHHVRAVPWSEQQIRELVITAQGLNTGCALRN